MTPNLPNPNTPGPERGSPSSIGAGALLRAAADGELSAEQQSQLDRHLASCPKDQARINFEKDLRKACARAMGADNGASIKAPASLRQSILDGLAAAERSAQPEVAGTIHPAGRIPSAAGRRRRYAGLLLAAAALPLVVAGWLIYANRPAPPASTLPIDTLFAAYKAGANIQSIPWQKVGDEVKKLIGIPVSDLDELEQAGFKYVGLGHTRMPSGNEAAHLVFHRFGEDEGRAPVKLSVFVENDRGKRRYTEGLTWLADGRPDPKAEIPHLRTWLQDGKVVTVVSSCRRTGGLARKCLHGPDTEEQYFCGQSNERQ